MKEIIFFLNGKVPTRHDFIIRLEIKISSFLRACKRSIPKDITIFFKFVNFVVLPWGDLFIISKIWNIFCTHLSAMQPACQKCWITNKLCCIIKGCLSLFNYFIDMSPTLMSPFFVEKTRFFPSKTCFFHKKWTH